MGVYIKDMEMPKLYKTHKVRFAEEGGKILVGFADENSTAYRPIGEAIPVPAHGRLIDADALIAKLNMMIAMAFGEGNTAFHFAYRSLGKVVENAPTIIEAEEGE